MYIGAPIKRVDGYDKAAGRARFTEDLCPKSALVAKVLHAKIAHGFVKEMDISEAEKVPGVVRILTCFDAPDRPFATDGHPWTMAHEKDFDGPHDNMDRRLLNRHIRLYGDDIAAVVARDSVAADRALRLIRVTYEEEPFVLDAREARKEGAPQIHEDKPENVCAETEGGYGDYDAVTAEEGLLVFDEWYSTSPVQHAHLENPTAFAYEENGKIVITTSTQLPHIVRRVVAQALGREWGDIRVIKPYVGGGFGNKQDVLYEPLCAWLCTQVGGRCVRLDNTREETFANTRVRHSYDMHLITHVRPDGRVAARFIELWSHQGAYTSHGHGVVENSIGAYSHMYPCDAMKTIAHSIYTNAQPAGAMRAYGFPQAIFAADSHMESIARKMGIDPLEFRLKNMMQVGHRDDYTNSEVYEDGLRQCVAKGRELFHYEERKARAAAFNRGEDISGWQLGGSSHAETFTDNAGQAAATAAGAAVGRDIRRGIGVAIFWYTSGVWPFYVETDTCNMIVNQDGSIQLQMAEVEIGQGADTVFCQMAADVVGVPFDKIHIVSTQDTDVTPLGTGAYGSRQTFVGSFSIHQTGSVLKDKILKKAEELTGVPVSELDMREGVIFRRAGDVAGGTASSDDGAGGAPASAIDDELISAAAAAGIDGEPLMTLKELSMRSIYNQEHSEQLTAETTAQSKANAFNYGCTFVEVEVDIPMCKVKVLDMLNVHDCGKVINPLLAEAQVHGGMSMALGYALSEEVLHDPKTGRMLNNNLLDYKLLTFMDHPRLNAAFVETREPATPFGNRSLGEPPTISGAPAVRNAILDATGVACNHLPMTPKYLFRRFKEAGLI